MRVLKNNIIDWAGAWGFIGFGVVLYAFVIAAVLGFWAVLIIFAVKLVKWAWGGGV